MSKKPRFIDGYSESLWKSLVVKSVRMGWLTGLEVAHKKIAPSTIKGQLKCGLFEDVFPTEPDLPSLIRAVENHDYETLVAYDTHHGRGYSDQFCDMEDEAVAAMKQRSPEIFAHVKQFDIWLPPRALNCYYTWMKIRPSKKSARDIDRTPWSGMPKAMADMHTVEGKRINNYHTVLSGTYSQHRTIGLEVQEHGWNYIREQVHNGKQIEPHEAEEQGHLF